MKGKKGVIFGVFDRLHPGHIYFINKAKEYVDELIVSVTDDGVVFDLKNKYPKLLQKERMSDIEYFDPKLKVVPGDTVLGSWSAIKKYKPDLVILGYDQNSIREQLLKDQLSLPKFEVIQLESFEPDKYHSSLL